MHNDHDTENDERFHWSFFSGQVLFWGLALGFVLQILANQEEPVKLLVDAEISRGSQLELFYNEKYQATAIIPGQRHVYEFNNIDPVLNTLRIDPGDLSDLNVKIYSVTVNNNEKYKKIMGPKDLGAWGKNNLNDVKNLDDHIEATSTSNDPMIISNIAIDVSAPRDSFRAQASYWIKKTITEDILFYCFILFLLLNFSLKAAAASLIAIFLYVEPLKWIFPIFDRTIRGNPPAVNKVLGFSSYYFYPKSRELKIFLAEVLVGALIGFALSHLRVLRRTITPPVWAQPSLKKQILTIALPLFIFFVFAYPPANVILGSLAGTHHSDQWDAVNMLAWSYAHLKGFLPLKDFFYPYGGQYLLSSPTPGSLHLQLLHEMLLAFVFIFSVYWLTQRRAIATFVIVLVVGILIQRGFITAAWRYFVCFSVLLFYLALRRQPRAEKWGWLALGALTSWLFFFEPNQIIYLAGGVFCSLIPEYLNGKPLSKILKDLLRPSLFFLVFLAAYFVYLKSEGRWQGFVDFYSTLTSIAANAAIPENIALWFRRDTSVNAFVVMGLATFLIFSAISRFRGTNTDIVMGTFGLGIMVFMKHLTRPHMANQFAGFFVVGAMIYLSLECFPYMNRRQFHFLLLFVGAYLMSFLYLGFITAQAGQFVNALAAIPGNFSTLFVPQKDVDQAINSYLAPQSFQVGGVKGDEFNKFFEQRYSPTSRVYGFGDGVVFHMLRGQPIPYFLTFYDGAHINFQHKVLDDLQAAPPDVVIWNPGLIVFDSVPVLLKCPLLFEYVVDNFKSDITFQGFEFLVPRKETPVDWAYWVKRLGPKINLGAVPYLSRADRLKECKEHCTDVLFLEANTDFSAKERSFKVKAGEYEVELSFHADSIQNKISLNLERIWLWNLGKKYGLKPEIILPTDADFKTHIETRESDPYQLY